MTRFLTLAERLVFAMKRANISQKNLAKSCRVAPPSVHGWLSGKSKFMRGENLLSASKALTVAPLWLASGKGSLNPKVDDLKMFDDLWAKSLQFDDCLLDRYRQLTATQRNLCQFAFLEQLEKFER